MRGSAARPDHAASASAVGTHAARGYTLLEVVIVTSILAVLAAVALPGMRVGDTERLDLAAAWIAETVRFAHAEALRTRTPVYLEINRDTERLLVAVADLSGSTVAPGQTLRDPITKQPLDLILSTAPATAGLDITNRPFDYPSGGAQNVVVFDAQGLPFRKSAGASQRMTLGQITLTRRGQQRTVQVAATTGRVTIQ